MRRIKWSPGPPKPHRWRRNLTAGVAGLLVVSGLAVVANYYASAEETTQPTAQSDFVRIQDVPPNVVTPPVQAGGSTGVFTVDCGNNENGNFTADNPVAQHNIANGAQHEHTMVGNTAYRNDTSDEAMDAADTTCRNGDKSAYFWVVVRINPDAPGTAGAATSPGTTSGSGTAEGGTLKCPSVADQLPAVPSAVRSRVNSLLAQLDRQVAAASRQLAANPNGGTRFMSGLLDSLRNQRAAVINQITNLIDRFGRRPRGLTGLAECDISFDAAHAGHTTPPGETTPTVNCPTVRDQLPGIPDRALDQVDSLLAQLDRQIVQADTRLTAGERSSTVLRRLRLQRLVTLGQITNAIDRFGPRPSGLTRLAGCSVNNPVPGESPTTAPAPSDEPSAAPSDDPTGADPSAAPSDEPSVVPSAAPSTAPATSAAPLPAPAGPNLEIANNIGRILPEASNRIEFLGNPTSKVVAMPQFIGILTGESKPAVRGPGAVRATWTCTGFENRRTTKYVICPPGSRVERIHDFPSCWNGKDIDSPNHKTHIVFEDPATGACPEGTVAVPQLRITLTYNIPLRIQQEGKYQLDSFPEELTPSGNHDPSSDHNDFKNDIPADVMNRMVACINAGRRCSE